MNETPKLARRRFAQLCASAIAMVSAHPKLLASQSDATRRYDRVQLVHKNGRPVTSQTLAVGETHLFYYPYVATPCFLLNLGRPMEPVTALVTEDGRTYESPPGAGSQKSILAYSAICAHRMTHPARQVSFMNYRHDSARFVDADSKPAERSSVIYCCSEKSVYDATRGARVLGGPAPQPLAAISLEQDEQAGTLYATGTYGGEMFEQFFQKFGFRLALEFGTSNIRRRVSQSAEVVPLADYCQTQVLC